MGLAEIGVVSANSKSNGCSFTFPMQFYEKAKLFSKGTKDCINCGQRCSGAIPKVTE